MDLHDLLDTCIELARATVHQVEGQPDGDTNEVELVLDDVPPGSVIHGDPKLLQQALTNVIENALQAVSEGGSVVIRSGTTDLRGVSATAVAISDDGHGMDGSVRAKAKEPFFTTRSRGTGLGLAIVERIAANHGGTLAIETAPGEGTTVTLVVPNERISAIPVPPPDPFEETGVDANQPEDGA